MSTQIVTLPGGLANLAIPSKHKHPPPDAPANLFKLHTLAGFIGARGSGKTNACVLLAREYLRHGSFNRVFLITPTYESNPIFDELKVDPEDIYEDLHHCQDALRSILDKIETDRLMYDAMKEYRKLWKKYSRKPEHCTPAELSILEEMQYQPPVELPFPAPLIVIDDMSHSDIFSISRSNPFINLCLRHRHIFSGTGCTIFMLLQNFKSHGSIPKPLRENIQQWFLWRIRDMTVLRAIHSEFANLLNFETFLQLYHTATAENEHDFLTVDLNPIDKVMQFRKNFDQVLVPPLEQENSSSIDKDENSTVEENKSPT